MVNARKSRPARRTRRASDESAPKTTRPEASERREPEPARSTAEKLNRKLDAFPDRVDIRDWVYQPRLFALPDQLVNIDHVPEILDQGREGACTGFALAAVINYLLADRRRSDRVSPRMLYELARRYDEWPGEEYEGSSARGAMKGWVRHGVCTREHWPDDLRGFACFTPERSTLARGFPGGAFYRVDHRQVRDLHAALNEIGILYVTLMVHEGWQSPGGRTVELHYVESGSQRDIVLPVVERKGRADGGHAIALVGYTPQGFIIQNSWGEDWGAGGFALLPYEDFMLHATDVWAAQLGVPVTADLWANGAADTDEGLQRAAPAISLDTIRPYAIDIGNNGELSRSGNYWTTEDDVERLFQELIPRAAAGWEKRRVLLYLHGGLNDERAVARRIVAFRDVLLENEIYPLHIMWESGIFESLSGMMEDLFGDVDERAGRADWLNRFREGLLEARDLTLELTAAVPGSRLWGEMKENAGLASRHPDGKGGMQLIAEHALKSLERADAAERGRWELHVVGHSAGSIFAGAAVPHLARLGDVFKTMQFLAPAIRVDRFREEIMKPVEQGACPHPTVYLLSDVGERDDEVGPYGKSLLYLVSNAFEGRRETPILGMERFIADDGDVRAFFERETGGLPSLVVAGASRAPDSEIDGTICRSNSHGGFDNDPATLNSMLFRVLGRRPARPFTVRDLQY